MRTEKIPDSDTVVGGRGLSRHEIVADGIVHAVGIVGAVAGIGVLLGITLLRSDPLQFAALAIYGGGLLAMLGCSAAYNLMRVERWRGLLRRFDHAAIFAMIAGTYTPFTMLAFDAGWAYGLTALIWTLATIGIVLRLRYQHRFEALFVVFYLALGWIGIVALGPLLSTLGAWTVGLLIAGGSALLDRRRLPCLGTIAVSARRLAHLRDTGGGVHYAAVLAFVVTA